MIVNATFNVLSNNFEALVDIFLLYGHEHQVSQLAMTKTGSVVQVPSLTWGASKFAGDPGSVGASGSKEKEGGCGRGGGTERDHPDAHWHGEIRARLHADGLQVFNVRCAKGECEGIGA